MIMYAPSSRRAGALAQKKPHLLLDNDITSVRDRLSKHGYKVTRLWDAGLPENAPDERVFEFAAASGMLLLTADKHAYLSEERMPVRKSGGVVVLPNSARREFYEAALEHFARTCPQEADVLKQRIIAYEVDKRAVGRRLYRNEYAPAETGGRRLVSSEKVQPA